MCAKRCELLLKLSRKICPNCWIVAGVGPSRLLHDIEIYYPDRDGVMSVSSCWLRRSDDYKSPALIC